MNNGRNFYYKGTWYTGYIVVSPSNSMPGVNVVERDNNEVVENIEVLEYAHDLFEDLGYI